MTIIAYLVEGWIALWIIRGIVWIVVEAVKTAIGGQR
jgi:hypothetical protein